MYKYMKKGAGPVAIRHSPFVACRKSQLSYLCFSESEESLRLVGYIHIHTHTYIYIDTYIIQSYI